MFLTFWQFVLGYDSTGVEYRHEDMFVFLINTLLQAAVSLMISESLNHFPFFLDRNDENAI